MKVEWAPGPVKPVVVHMAKLCENVRVNERNRFVLDGLFHYIIAPGFPCEHSPCFAVAEIALDRETGNKELALSIRLKNPRGDVIQSVTSPPQRHGDGPFGHSVRIMAAQVLEGFVLEEPGLYAVEVLIDENVVGSDILAVMTTDELGKVLG